MRHKRLKLSTLFLIAFGLSGLQAQESVHASGGNASGSGGSVSYSIGQVSFQTYKSINGSISQGVQQPYEISVITAIENAKDINLLVSVYPNPASDYLTLEVNEFNLSNLSFRLYDINGKLLQSGQITGIQTRIVMSNLIPSGYFVKVLQRSREVKTFKIIKN